jgi:histone acetyltransferase (RNA polymerase elongator complex component)
MIAIKPITCDDMEHSPRLGELIAEYSAESNIPELAKHQTGVRVDIYRALEAAGVARMLGAYDDDELVGFLLMIVSDLPHYGVRAATTESYFVQAVHRSGGAGLKLLHEAERIAQEAGAVGLLVSAPTGSRLDQVLPHVGYKRTNEVYFRELAS